MGEDCLATRRMTLCGPLKMTDMTAYPMSVTPMSLPSLTLRFQQSRKGFSRAHSTAVYCVSTTHAPSATPTLVISLLLFIFQNASHAISAFIGALADTIKTTSKAPPPPSPPTIPSERCRMPFGPSISPSFTTSIGIEDLDYAFLRLRCTSDLKTKPYCPDYLFTATRVGTAGLIDGEIKSCPRRSGNGS